MESYTLATDAPTAERRMIMWEIKDKYKECCHNEDCESFNTCIECWDEWAERNPPITNADRIRAMSDEELATHLYDIGWDCHLCAEHRRLDNEPLLRGEKCDENCFEHCLEWLKQPAEETVYCKDCEHLMFSDCYGECSKGHKGIVHPDDTCKHGVRRKANGV